MKPSIFQFGRAKIDEKANIYLCSLQVINDLGLVFRGE